MFLFAQWPNWCAFWSGWMWVLPFYFIVMCIVGMLFCRRMCFGQHCMPWMKQGKLSSEAESPLDIAKRRFAKGEITKEEYEDIKRTIA